MRAHNYQLRNNVIFYVASQSKVTKRIWVLHECLERVPEDLDSTKTLLKYGLHGTNLHVLTIMSEKNADHPFVKDQNDESDEENCEKNDEKKMLKNIDFKKYV